MRRPYDFMSLLKQAERADKLKKLRDELIERKAEIDQNEDKDTGQLLLSLKSIICHGAFIGFTLYIPNVWLAIISTML